MNNFFSKVMTNDPSTTLYIRKGPKSRLYGLAAHTKGMVKTNGKVGPTQSSLFLGMYDSWEEAMNAFNYYLPKKLINWRREDA